MTAFQYAVGLFFALLAMAVVGLGLVALVVYRPRRVRLPRHDRHAR
ncbi:hypothetical protein [Streptomyces antimicrobicus]|uniref:Uncharacterized protein n=1 Tax=Streptomyces antimicrobicus TaxID=2883108 RepID=A0ABS8BA62_9ACTN|nr:hypothetical protein [Streptomyces antimicrobicus]MCB5181495.1 hypothetical protein [Streptomyces antimicrobicus]